MKNGRIILNLEGTPSKHCPLCLSTGHGYYAYVSSNDPFIHTLFRDVCMWGGFTDVYHDRAADAYYNQYELDCRDKVFFKSHGFERICERHNVELVICEDDMTELWNFFDSVRR